jgi:tetratricopeptide (TPR) repeat protein
VGHRLLAAAGGLGDDALLAAARELAENHLLIADGSGEGYTFRHALTREAVYDDLLPGERQQLHRALARALIDEPALGPPAGWAVAQAVAEHWFAAGELEEALTTSVAAGSAAREVLAVADALDHYERALALWDRVAHPEKIAGMGRPDLLERAAETASGAGEHDLAIRYIDAAIEELEPTPAPSTQLGMLCEQKTWYLDRAGRQAELLEWTEHAATLVPSGPPTPGHGAVLAAHANALAWGQERYEEALRVAIAALEAARRAGARAQETSARNALGECLTMTSADAKAGIREFEQVLTIGREIGHADWVVYGYSNLTDTLIRMGRLDAAAATGLEGADVGMQLGAIRERWGRACSTQPKPCFLPGNGTSVSRLSGGCATRASGE